MMFWHHTSGVNEAVCMLSMRYETLTRYSIWSQKLSPAILDLTGNNPTLVIPSIPLPIDTKLGALNHPSR